MYAGRCYHDVPETQEQFYWIKPQIHLAQHPVSDRGQKSVLKEE